MKKKVAPSPNLLGPDPTPVSVDDPASDGETEARTSVSGFGATPVAFEDVLEIFGSDPGPRIRDDEEDLILSGPGLEPDESVARDLDRVADQVGENLNDAGFSIWPLM